MAILPEGCLGVEGFFLTIFFRERIWMRSTALDGDKAHNYFNVKVLLKSSWQWLGCRRLSGVSLQSAFVNL